MDEFSKRKLGDGRGSKNIIEEDYHDDCDFSGHEILRYINQILMEEDVDDETLLLQESSDFQAIERSFHEVLGQVYPPSPRQDSGDNNNNYVTNHHNSTTSSSDSFIYTASKLLGINHDVFDHQTPTDKVHSDINNSNEVKQCEAKARHHKKELIDFTNLLMECAQSIDAGDRGSANELLRRIRKHASPLGDGNQRLAHYFADGLEARMAGTGSVIHKTLVYRRTIPSDFMKAFSTYMASSPFGKTTFFALNKSMAIKSEKATRVHIIDFGILCGFQWPTFIQRLAERAGGPPKLRITGIDFPLPGFRPAERIETAGRWLTRHAEALNVPFEFHAIARKWETIKIEDLKICKGEFVAVSCSCRSKNLLDEPHGLESTPRDKVLDLIRRINPDIFMHGIVNAAYGDPFFVPRLRKALFHFSNLFDMMETIIARENPERLLIERDLFGKEVLNIIACEGWERVERPEPYKKWGLRHLRAGFMEIPFERKVMDTIMYKVRELNRREFVVFEENNWLLLSWRGRIVYAISCWQPAAV